MKQNRVKKAMTPFFVLGLFSLGGCYTVLMDPSMLASSDDENFVPTSSQSDSTLDISYNRNYLSRDPYGWQVPAACLPWWYEVIAPAPPTAVASASPSAGVESGLRQRTIGTTRGNDRSRSDIQASAPVTTTTIITTPLLPTATVVTPSSTTADRSRTTGNNSATSTTQRIGSNRGGERK